MPDFDHYDDRPTHPDARFEAGRRRDALEAGEVTEDARRARLDRDEVPRRSAHHALDGALKAHAELVEVVAALRDRLEPVLAPEREGPAVAEAAPSGDHAPLVRAIDDHAESLRHTTRRLATLLDWLAL